MGKGNSLAASFQIVSEIPDRVWTELHKAITQLIENPPGLKLQFSAPAGKTLEATQRRAHDIWCERSETVDLSGWRLYTRRPGPNEIGHGFVFLEKRIRACST